MFVMVVFGMNPRVLLLSGRQSTADLYPQPPKLNLTHIKQTFIQY